MARKKDEASLRSEKKYKDENTVVKTIRFFPKDMEILEHAVGTGDFSGYVKGLMRSDLAKKKAEQRQDDQPCRKGGDSI